MAEDGNGWAKYGERVLSDMERLTGCYDDLLKKTTKIEVEVAVLKLKAGVWGFLSGLVSVVGLLLYLVIRELMKK